jgi:hypothetical protein
MRIIYTFILITFFSLQVVPQITFEKTFGTIDDDEACAVSVCYDGTYIIAGTVDNIYTGDPDVYLARLDQYGDTIWTRSFVNEYCYDYAYDLLQSYDSGFIITGYTYSEDTTMPFLLKYDKSGQFMWFKRYGLEISEGYGYAVVEKPDSGYMICGRQDFYNMRWYYRPFLLETDESGDCTWFKIYDEFSEYAIYEASNICLSAENEYVLCGVYEEFFVDDLDQAWLFKVDSNTNVAWEKTYGFTDYTTHLGDVKLTDDEGYILCGIIYHGDVILPDMDYDIYLVKTDNEGNEEWRKSLGYDDRAEYGACINITDDGGFIIGSGSNFGSDYDDIWLVKTNGSGDTLWTRRYGGTLSESISDICTTPDGGYIMCGSTKSYGLGGSDIYVIKTDDNGLLTSVNEKNDELSEVEVFPNPGNGLFRIRNCPDDLAYSIYNLNGQIVVKDKAVISLYEEADIRSLPAGMYFLQLKSATSASSVKIIKNQ